ncbi:hypothetical protein D9545_15655, partial [Geobacillus stearothermophilus]
FLQWFGLDTFTIQENSHFLYPLFSLCTPIFNDQVQLVVKSQNANDFPRSVCVVESADDGRRHYR